MPDTIRVGLLGYGLAGRLLHAPFIRAVSGFTLAAVVTSRADQVAADFPGAAVYTDIDDLLRRDDIDLVVVTTPHRFHVEHAAAALDTGKHVVVEKPVTDALDEMRGLIERARDAGRVLIPYQQRRFDGDFRTVQQIVASGVLGRIHHVESHWHMYRPKPKGVWRESAGEQGGIFYDLGPHLIDHTLQLFGRPHSVYAQIEANRGVIDVDDLFRLNLHYRNGLHVLLSADNLNPFPPPRFVVRGLNGAFVKYGMDPQEALLRAGHRPVNDAWGREEPDQRGRLMLRAGDVTAEGAVDGLPGDWRLYWRGVYDAIVHGAPPPVDPADLLPQIEIMQAARESSRTGAAQVLPGA